MARHANLPALLRSGAAERGEKPALLQNRDGRYQPVVYREFWRRVDDLAAALRRRGISGGDRVALLLPNGPEWIIADQAILSLGAVDVPLYASLTPPQVDAILTDAACMAAFVEEGELHANLARAEAARALRLVVVVPAAGDGPRRPEGGAAGVGDAGGPEPISLADLLAEGKAVGAAAGDDEPSPPGPDDLATIIYTSGTTGTPKGVMLTHGNFMANVVAAREAVAVGADDVFVSFLPLSHVFERVASHYVGLCAGASIAYAEAPETVVADMMEVRPTIVLAVPRFFEKARARVLDMMAEAPPLRRRLFRWALRTGARHVDEMRRQVAPRARAPLHRLADLLVLRKLQARFGGRLRFFVSGGAALAPEVERFFWGTGVPVLQGYGLTETSPITSVNRPGASRPGTGGPALPGVEIRIGEEGEILVRGGNVMKGYWNRPQETAQAIDAEGWLHTGDVGRLTPEGHLVITDRRKDLIVLSTGKNVYPQEVEFALAQSPWVLQLLVVGDGRSRLGALVVPDFDFVRRRFPALPQEEAAREAWMAANEDLRRTVVSDLSRVQEGLAPYQRVRRVRLLGREFRAEENEITPSLKLRRAYLLHRLAERIEALYRADGGAWEIA